jgi:hypothetical protein
VPRNSGTCTRVSYVNPVEWHITNMDKCPLEINISESQDPEQAWICKVFLHKKYTYVPSGASTAPSKSRPFGPWYPLEPPQEMHFATITSKEEVGSALYWAQIATLNPSQHHELYKPTQPNRPSEDLQVKFSPNVVRVDVSFSLDCLWLFKLIQLRSPGQAYPT